MPAAPTARAPQPTSIDRRERRAIPDGKTFPWHRPASTATIFGRFLIARTFLIAEAEVAGPSPVSLLNQAITNADIANPFLTNHAAKKIIQM
jgi:hypothetical protein